MKLREYLAHRDISLSDFARSINVSAQAVHRYVSGERIPHPKIMERIRAQTHGTVGPDDFYTRVAA